MKVQVVYTSLSGCTRRLAEGIYNAIDAEEKSLHDLADGEPVLDGDVILLGYWVDKGGPNAQMKAFMEKVEGKTVGVFSTLAYWADSTHGHQSIVNGVNLLKDKNVILGGYVCNGCMSQEMIARFRAMGSTGPHSASPESEARWEVMANHPTACEIALGAERFNDRLRLLKRLNELGLTYASVHF